MLIEELCLQADSVESELWKVMQFNGMAAGMGGRPKCGLFRVGAGAFNVVRSPPVRALEQWSVFAQRDESRWDPFEFILLDALFVEDLAGVDIRFFVHRILTSCVRCVHVTWISQQPVFSSNDSFQSISRLRSMDMQQLDKTTSIEIHPVQDRSCSGNKCGWTDQIQPIRVVWMVMIESLRPTLPETNPLEAE